MDLKAAAKRAAAGRGVPEAEDIRVSTRASAGQVRPRPRGGLYANGRPIGRQAEELLAGFGGPVRAAFDYGGHLALSIGSGSVAHTVMAVSTSQSGSREAVPR